MTFNAQILSSYMGYSYDPRFRGTVIYAGQDRGTGANFATRGAIWEGAWTLLPDPDSSIRRTIAEDGDGGDRAVGHITLNSPELFGRAVVWDRSGGAWSPLTLPLPQGVLSSLANSLSPDTKRVAGEVDYGGGDSHAALWTEDANGTWTTEVLPKPGFRAAPAPGLTDADVLYGTMDDTTKLIAGKWTRSAGIWSVAQMPVLPGQDPTTTGGDVARHSPGWACGSLRAAGGKYRAVRWDAADMPEDLNAGDDTFASAIWAGDVAGIDISTGQKRAFYWTPANGRVELHPAGYDWSEPGDLNEAGQIVGVAGINDPVTGKPKQIDLILWDPA